METNLFQTVYQHPLLRREDYAAIARIHTRIEWASGTLLLEKGKTAKSFFVIEKGLFRSVLYDHQGKEITTEFYCPGEIVIESFSLFQRIPSKESFQALSDSIAWKIEYEAFQELLDELEGLREWGRIWASQQLFVSKQRSLDRFTVSATDRYLNLMKERPQIIQYSPLKYIASYLGITDTSLSRIRHFLS